MAAEVKVLVEGFTSADYVAETGEERVRPTITLVRDGNLVMVVDPGILESQQILIDALEKENLTVDQVNYVCITHSHIDHYRNIGMFANAKTLEYYGIWDKGVVENWHENFTENIQVFKMPGHDYTGISLFVTTSKGVVAICGDVFWKEDYPKDPKDDAYALDPEKLKESRELVLEKSDWIIPGHAGMYKVKKVEIAEGVEGKKLDSNKIIGICRKCHQPIRNKLLSCRCRPYLCYRCCECGIDCDLCNCSHRAR